MEVKTYNSITEIDETKWDEITGRNRIFCSYRFLLAVEKSNINDCQYFYPVVYHNDKIVAHTCAYSISTELDVIAKGITKKIINNIRKIWKNFLVMRFIECGLPVAIGTTISFRENFDKVKLLNLITESIEELARSKNIKNIVIRDFHAEERTLFDNLKNLGYGIINNLPCAVLKIRWDSFDEYLNSMRSHYRQNLRTNQKIFKNSGIQLKLEKNYLPYSETFVKLWRVGYDNAKEYRRSILTPDFFQNMNKYLSDQSESIILTKDNNIIGFLWFIYNDEILEPLFMGSPLEMKRKYKIYFNMLYKTIEIAIQNNMTQVNFAITTLEPKKQLGADPITLYMYIKHLNPIFNLFIAKLYNMVSPKPDLLSKNVFK